MAKKKKDDGRLTADKLNDAGCLRLAEAILEGAVEDYRAAARAYRRHPKDKKLEHVYNLRRRFFRSEYFAALNLTGMSSREILEQLDKGL